MRLERRAGHELVDLVVLGDEDTEPTLDGDSARSGRQQRSARSTGAAGRSGTTTLISVPRPGSEVTLIWPAMASTRLRVIDSPRPVPPKRRAVSTRPARSTRTPARPRAPSLPGPVSITLMRTSLCEPTCRRTVTEPVSVNLTALATRLVSTCCRRSGSLRRRRTRPSSTSRCRPIVLSRATRWLGSTACCATSTRSSSAWSICNAPASILAVSSTSFTSASRRRAARCAAAARRGPLAEYYEPFTGEPLGSLRQSWTAAVALNWLTSRPTSRGGSIRPWRAPRLTGRVPGSVDTRATSRSSGHDAPGQVLTTRSRLARRPPPGSPGRAGWGASSRPD